MAITSVLSLFLIFLVISFLVQTKQNSDNSSKKLNKSDNSGIQIIQPHLNISLSNEKTEKLTNEASMSKESSQQVLEIIATDTTWILANIDGTELKEVLMKPGESVKWRARKSFSLKIGNAGGVRLNLNGEEIEKLGEIGQVVSIDLPHENKNM